jgi:hypothetical protein
MWLGFGGAAFVPKKKNPTAGLRRWGLKVDSKFASTPDRRPAQQQGVV